MAAASRASALPKPPTRISEKLQAYRQPTIQKSRFDRGAAAASARSAVRREAPAASVSAASSAFGQRSQPLCPLQSTLDEESKAPARGSGVARLTDLSLRTIAANFEANPRIEGLAPEYALAITSSLPLSLDVGVTGPHVADEHYWKRVALEHFK
jgi:hypothetical protein